MNSEQKVIAVQWWWMEELRAITRKVMNQEDRRQAREKIKHELMLADYSSREEIIDAYGFDYITEKQKDKLLDLWDKANAGPDDLYQAKIELLQEVYAEAQEILRNNGQEV